MPAAHAALIPELEQALCHISVDRYAETVRRVADFFLAGAAQFNPDHVQLFDRVLGRLVVAVENKVLGELARRLAPIRNAPPDVMRRLAGNADIAVAAPVLTRSTRLADADLIAIATTQSQAHRLAISGRSVLSEAVTDLLVECGDRDVARNLAANRGARFTETGIAVLAVRAVHDPVLAEKLAQRPDVPTDVLHGLMREAAVDVRQRLMAIARADEHAEFAGLVAKVPPEITDAAQQAQAWREVRLLKGAGRLTEAELLAFAADGRTKHMHAALALICDVSIDVVRRLMSGEEPEAALMLCQAAGLSWPAARAIVEAGHAAAARRADKVFDDFAPLLPSTATHIVGFLSAAAA